jgi:isopenicillin N synthase-like dioxygenase
MGFFYLKGHGISSSELKGIRDEASRFFSMPEELKEEVSMARSSSYRGYQRVGENVTYAKKAGAPLPDWHEAFDTYR